MEQYAGLDVSLEQTSVCVVDGTGRIVCVFRVMAGSDFRRWRAAISRHRGQAWSAERG